MTRQRRSALIAVFLFLALCYLCVWIYSAWWFNRQMDRLYANTADTGIEFLGPRPSLGNFPLMPRITYTGGIKAGNTSLLFPELRLSGFPVPFLTLHVDFPQGVSLGGIVDPKIWSLDHLSAAVVIPYKVPRTISEEDLALWQSRGGKLEIRRYKLTKGALQSDGRGALSLDRNLQPMLSFESNIRGYADFIAAQSHAGLIESFPAAVGTALLNSFAKTDERTSVKTVTVKVSVQNRLLMAGPLAVLPLPEIVWDKRNPPVQPR